MDSENETVLNLEPLSSDDVSLADQTNNDDLMGNMQSRISQEVAGQLWQAGKQSTQRFISAYGHIDFLRPYFDVEPKEFRNRLFGSFIPSRPFSSLQDSPSELYGPLMLTFSLVAVLLYGMKSFGHKVEEGTLIGTAMAVCFGYWLGVSSLLFFIAYLVNSQLAMVQVFSITGYSMSGHCAVLLLSTLFDHYGTSGMFYILWITIGGLSGLKVVGIYMSRTWSVKEGVVLGCLSLSLHLLSILYLRLEYHKVYEALTEAF